MPREDDTEYKFGCPKCGTEFIATGYECFISYIACMYEDYEKSMKMQGKEMQDRADMVCVCPICKEYVNYEDKNRR